MMLDFFKCKLVNQRGQGMVEYAVIVAVVITIGVALLGDNSFSKAIEGVYESISTRVSQMIPPAKT